MMIYHASLAVLWLVLGYWPAGTSFSRKWRNSIGIPRGESCRARQGKKTMAEATAVVDRKSISSFKKWFLEGQVKEVEGPHEKEGQHHTHSWWQVMCLTGVDYFSTLGYQPSIAFVAAAALARQTLRAHTARLRRHRLHHHDHALRRRRHRAHRRQPVRAPFPA